VSHGRRVVPTTRTSRTAGFCLVSIILLGVAQALVVSPPFRDADPDALVASISNQALLFRLGVLADVLLYALVLVLSVALYLLVREVDRPLALGALVLRIAEGIVGLGVTVVGGVIPLLIATNAVDAASGVAAASFALRESALDIILVLIGLGGAVFSYLFLQSKLVPGGLAIWGIATYTSMVLLGSIRFLDPGLSASITSALYAQGGLFEVAFGLWLLIRPVAPATAEALSPSTK
jgi:hypothetical protein